MKRDGAKQLLAYVAATLKQGATLLPTTPAKTPKEARLRAAAIKRAIKKTSN